MVSVRIKNVFSILNLQSAVLARSWTIKTQYSIYDGGKSFVGEYNYSHVMDL